MEMRLTGNKDIECKGMRGPLQTSRLEMMAAWHRNGESWMDRRSTKEGEEESRCMPGGVVDGPFYGGGTGGLGKKITSSA